MHMVYQLGGAALLAAILITGVWYRSGKTRTQSGGEPDLVRGNNTFAFDLYHVVRESSTGNLIFSPYSISSALAMVYAGARGETRSQMADTLHFTLSQDELHAAFSDHLTALNTSSEEDEAFRLHIVNALWGQVGYTFLPEYLELLKRYYGAGLQELDFALSPDEARRIINEWVSRQTEMRIPDLLGPDTVSTDTRLILTNAIYFKAAWRVKFEEEFTSDEPFTLLDGTTITVPMMGQTEQFEFAVGDGYQAVLLPYEGDRAAMLVLLPDKGRFEDVEGRLSMDLLDEVLGSLILGDVHLSMPRFEYTSEFALAGALSAMGMTDAFTDEADFSGITGNRDLFINAVIHKAIVKVDETETEAAAASFFSMTLILGGEVQPVTEIRLDRPFLYVIFDRESSAILFVGRVLNPAE